MIPKGNNKQEANTIPVQDPVQGCIEDMIVVRSHREANVVIAIEDDRQSIETEEDEDNLVRRQQEEEEGGVPAVAVAVVAVVAAIVGRYQVRSPKINVNQDQGNCGNCLSEYPKSSLICM